MALNGIPITEDQCIGDTLPTLNNAFSALDVNTTNNALSTYSLFGRLENYALSADLPRPLVPRNSPTVNLFFNSSTGILSAGLLETKNVPITRCFNWVYTYEGSTLVWGAPYNGVNAGYPGAQTYLYNEGGILGQLSIADEIFTPLVDSVITITDVAYWNFDLATGSPAWVNSTSYDVPCINIQQAWDYKYNQGSWYDLQTSVDAPAVSKVKAIRGLSYSGVPVFEQGGCGAGSALILVPANAQMSFRPKFRFMKTSTANVGIRKLAGYGTHTVTIQPLNQSIF